MDIRPRARERNPISDANFFSRHFLFWFWPIFKLGYQGQLKEDDLWYPAPEDQAGVNGEQLETAWNKQNHQSTTGPVAQNGEQVKFLPASQASQSTASGDYKALANALRDTFGAKYLLVWPLLIITDCGLKVIQPWFMLLLVRKFIEEIRDETAQYIYAGGVCLATLFITLTSNPCLFYLGRLCQRCRISLTSLVQRKVLRLHASHKTNQGQMTNLMTNDTFTIEASLMQVPYLVIAPLQLAIFLGFLYVEFGWDSFYGVGFILLYMPFQYVNGNLSTKYRGKIGTKTDERSRLLSEVIDAIHSVKMYAWEFTFEKLLQQRRKQEVKQLKKRSRLHAFQMAVFLTSSRVVPFITFTAFVLRGGPLTADRVFYAVAAYNTMTHYMVFMLPGAIRALGEIRGSLARLQSFLQLPEKPLNESSYKHAVANPPKVSVDNVYCTWDLEVEPVLRNLNCQLKDNQLVFVVGKVGCGKTSLLHLILNELYMRTGKVHVNGTLSYAPQETKLFDGTIKDNILNSLPFIRERFERVIEAACLSDVIRDYGGERKVVGLSGGEKARVNLARALYREANIYLLDDPLSAVDANVSQAIFENAIQGFLGNSLRILVTHQLQYLKKADHIIVLDQGTKISEGKYSDVESQIKMLLGSQADASVDAILEKGDMSLSGATKNAAEKQETSVQIRDSDDDAEESKKGGLGFSIYWKYFSSGQSNCQLLTYFMIFIISQIFTTLIEYWLAMWTNAEERMYEESLAAHGNSSGNITESETDDDTFTWQGFEHFLSNLDNLEQNHYLYVYLVLTGIVFLTNLAKAVAFFQFCMRISINIHEKMLQSLLRAQPSVFDTNPAGRLMNRFTKDVAMIDEAIPFSFFDMWTIFLQVGTVILLIILAIWYSVFPIIVFLLLLGYVRKYYVATSRDLKRIDGTTRSPVISHAQATFSTIVTMRALNVQRELSTRFDYLQDINTSATISFLAASQSFNIWIELLATALLTFVAYGFLLAQNYLGIQFLSGNVGLAICSAMSLTIWLQYGMKVSANVENLMISVERALAYTKFPGEKYSGSNPHSGWPQRGRINFDKVSLSYTKDKQILKEVSFHLEPGQKIGIVGKTGAGKSSVLRGLFRMTEPTGNITVDGLHIREIDLHSLRTCMVVIPQDPKLFQGTLEFNLDPSLALKNDNNNRSRMEEIIERIKLHQRGRPIPLNFAVDDKGSNLSFGERQLVSIARALLLNRKIVCLDEATAHIDQGTDQMIQEVLHERLCDSTTITIAHRLGTVIESDKILVLHEGSLVEYDHPHVLLQKDGFLSKMVKSTDNAADLRDRARKSWERKNGGAR